MLHLVMSRLYKRANVETKHQGKWASKWYHYTIICINTEYAIFVLAINFREKLLSHLCDLSSGGIDSQWQ